MTSKTTWGVFTGNSGPHDVTIPEPPPWRRFDGIPFDRKLRPSELRAEFLIEESETDQIDLVNAALYLRRPLLITGRPGIGKSSLAHAVAHELKLGEVLLWPINTRTTLQEGLYRYDAIGRLHEKQLSGSEADIGKYVKLGPLGTALLPSNRPRVLLIDEIDKSDLDLPNDLLNVFEQATFEIPELSRLPEEHERVMVRAFDEGSVPISRGRVTSKEFPFVVMTSNGERDFPAPFLRRCIRLEMQPPSEAKLAAIVAAHLDRSSSTHAAKLIADFFERSKNSTLATDQLLNAVFLVTQHRVDIAAGDKPLQDSLIKPL
jgi:MoxR-like ATPase